MNGGLLSALAGGVLIGLGATLLWFANGRVAGVSGILGGVFRDDEGRAELVAFLAGLAAAGLLWSTFSTPPVLSRPPVGGLLVAGALVGFGTRIGKGCTSGHGVCGLSRGSPRSLAAVLTFMATGALTVFLLGRFAPDLLPR